MCDYFIMFKFKIILFVKKIYLKELKIYNWDYNPVKLNIKKI